MFPVNMSFALQVHNHTHECRLSYMQQFSKLHFWKRIYIIVNVSVEQICTSLIEVYENFLIRYIYYYKIIMIKIAIVTTCVLCIVIWILRVYHKPTLESASHSQIVTLLHTCVLHQAMSLWTEFCYNYNYNFFKPFSSEWLHWWRLIA